MRVKYFGPVHDHQSSDMTPLKGSPHIFLFPITRTNTFYYDYLVSCHAIHQFVWSPDSGAYHCYVVLSN